MDVALYTGNGGNQSITLPGGFNPDLVWVKSRSNSQDHYLFDAVRGGASILRSNTTGAESTGTTYLSFDTSGFSSLNGLSSNGYTYAAWTWDAGTSTVSNTSGSITSQVRANVSAGFSVVTYTGVTGNQSFGHGLGVKPKLIMIKNRSNSANWFVMVDIGTTYYKYGHLNTTDAFADATAQPVTSTTVTLGNNNAWFGANGDNYVAYCFAPVDGYSSAFTFTGNGSSDGPFCFLGFRPKLLLIKRSDSTGNWLLVDSVRGTYNLDGTYLYANTSDAEATQASGWDLLSNGFKNRNTYNDSNSSGATYVGFAWAENPFQYARAR